MLALAKMSPIKDSQTGTKLQLQDPHDRCEVAVDALDVARHETSEPFWLTEVRLGEPLASA